MSLVIVLSKPEALKAPSLGHQLVSLCEKVAERENHFIYIPLAGKIHDILKVLTQNHIHYELRNEPPE